MTDNVASLGFSVDSKPLDDAKQKLGEVSTEAGKTGKAVDDFNQKVGKTGTEASKAADGVGKITPALGAVESAARRAGVSVDEMQRRTSAFNKEADKLASTAKTSGTALGAVAKEAAAVGPAINAVAAASAAASKEHTAFGASATSLRGTIHGLNAVIGQFGGNLGVLAQAASASRLGLVGLAAAAGTGLAVAIAKATDEVAIAKNRLSGLIGSNEAGAKSYDAIKAAAKASGTEFSALERAVEGAKIGQEQFANKSVTYANTAEMVAKQTKEVGNAFSVVGSIMRGNLANTDEVNKAYAALGQTFETTGKFTKETLKTIRDLSPSTATALANAFGYKTVQDFNKELERSPIALDEFTRRLNGVKPKVDELFDPTKPKTYQQALEDVGKEWNEFLQTLTDTGAFELVKGALVGVGNAIKLLPGIIKNEIRDIQALGKLFEPVAKAIMAADAAVKSAGASVNAFAIQAIKDLTDLANSAIAAAQKVANAIASIARAASNNGQQGIGGAGNNPMGDQGGPQLSGDAGSYSSSVSYSGGSGGGSSTLMGGAEFISAGPSFGNDTSAINYGGGSTDYGYFASGGQFTVTGSGGTDSQTVSFKATPGEVVTVTPPEAAASGAVNIQGQPISTGSASVTEITDAISQSTIDISKQVAEGSDKIVSALKSATVDASTGLPISGTSTTGTSLVDRIRATKGLAVNGGGFSTRKSSDAGMQSTGGQSSGGAPDTGVVQGYGQPTLGSSGAWSGQPTGIFSGNGGYGGNYNGLDPNLFNYMNSLGYQYGSGIQQALFQSGQYSNDGQYTSNTKFFTGGIQSDIQINRNGLINDLGQANGIRQSVPMQYFDPYSAFSGNPYSYTQPYDDFAYNPYSAGGGEYPSAVESLSAQYGGGSGGGSSYSPFSDDSYFPSGSSYAGYDPNTINYGGGSFDAGYFATGGRFIVPGDPSSGTDKTLVQMHVTPGEEVVVNPTPSGVNVSGMPGANASSSFNTNNTSTTTKNVTINVMPGIQAESFIKSRAQIARGL